VTVLIVLGLVYSPYLLHMVTSMFFSSSPQKKKTLEKNIGIKSIAKILHISIAKKTKSEKEIWDLISSTNCARLRERVFEELDLLTASTPKSKSKHLLLEN
jgi:hypothetical protein